MNFCFPFHFLGNCSLKSFTFLVVLRCELHAYLRIPDFGPTQSNWSWLSGVLFFTIVILLQMQVWDTAGQERFRTITQSYYRSAHGAIVAYDITRRSTFESVPQWIREVEQLGAASVVIIIIGKQNCSIPQLTREPVLIHKLRLILKYFQPLPICSLSFRN